MKKILSYFIAVILFSSCATLNQGNTTVVNKCAEILRTYGYEDISSGPETVKITQSDWNHPIYHKVWYFKRGNYRATIYYEAGDTEKNWVICRFNYGGQGLYDKLRFIGADPIDEANE